VAFVTDVATGMVRYHLGDLAVARTPLEAALEYDLPIPDVGWSLHNLALSYLALTLVHLGYPDQARARSGQARERATLGRPADQAQAALFDCMLQHLLHKGDGLMAIATDAVRACSENGIVSGTLPAMAHVGFARVAAGDPAGLDEIRTIIDGYRSSQQTIVLPELLAGLVQASLVAGRTEGAFDVLADARATIAATGDHLYTPELHRLEGELHRARGATEDAELCFRRALDAAVAQGTRSWELRARLSLAQLQLGRGDRSSARATIRPIVDFQTEGADMQDVRAARAVLAAPS